MPLIHPVNDEPKTHVTFRGPFMSDLDDKGETTVRELELNRKDLLAMRAESLKQIKSEIRRIREITDSQKKDMIVRQIWKEAEVDKEYSAMMTCFLNQELKDIAPVP